MDRGYILQLIGEEISRLERVREILTSTNGHRALNGHIAKATVAAPKKRFLSEDARNRIAQAQKRRWAKQRKEVTTLKKVG